MQFDKLRPADPLAVEQRRVPAAEQRTGALDKRLEIRRRARPHPARPLSAGEMGAVVAKRQQFLDYFDLAGSRP